jgi:predicted transcriptional regulator
MATQTIKTTYSLDVETVRKLEQMARRWNVSKSEALRRAIRAAATEGLPGEGREAIEALDELQRSLGLDAEEAVRWGRAARVERQASSRRREKGVE